MKFVVEKKEIDVYEKTENCGVGGEGDSSRAHGIPNGTGNNQLSIKKRGDGTVASLYVVWGSVIRRVRLIRGTVPVIM